MRVGTIKSAADTRYLLQSHVDMVISLCPLTPMEGNLNLRIYALSIFHFLTEILAT